MSEKSREEEKLSFKEQILRDLEKVKGYDEVLKEDEAVVRIPANEPSAEELMADSLSTVEEIMRKAPTVPTHPSQDVPASPADEIQRETPGVPSHPSQDVPSSPAEESGSRPGPGPVRPKKFEREYNETPTRVAVSYKTAEKKAEQAGPETPTPATETVDIISDTPRRSRREGAKSVKPKKEKKSHVKAFVISFLVFLALLSAGGYFGYQYVLDSLLPIDANSKKYVTVQIPDGSNVQEIGTTLEKAGLVKQGLIFSFYAKYKNYTDLKAGYYNLQKSMSTEDLLKELQKGGTDEPQEPVLATLTIPEGYTLDQIAQAVGQLQGDFKEPLTAEAFLAKVQDETFISQEVAKYPSLLESLPTKESGVRYRLEGYLFPATYSIKESTTVESLIDEMLAATDKNLSPYYSTIKSKNLTVNELLTIASLVEKEGAKTEDRKLIAGVFYNRLNRDMPLQSNIAILYAQGKLGQNISLAEDVAIDTNIDSPYNVYKNVGLMPGPVDSPSLDAIESSINQTKSDNLYFVADVTDGKVYYANNQEDHDRNVAEHVNSKLNQTN
ncbi:aminodeoxychorismate lyase [Streptococcus pneumoniae]|uniref:endolytic transglycosylase MltG n=1 Tax=Streptococcus pneumoniae TaxID=1313 RepID=UPI000343CF60|nr:endolytic transglycosylase MltG [Streptococcus pneumoniae]EPD15449.1 putative aminodeoxychorismate lyase [Streptococcus pneumoniae MNZ11b]EPD16939.1 putative aminodeoxychorismate lyase [Streptococcus pneumoniae MNZ37]OPA71695.1 aminodeoxychorismate lyase [Streptococcus pneumoniae]CRC06195.1 aminodeoxychorismate lyase [Streptococcus pneumoniae]CTO96971.1 aminodeoxychorismate lyase [Streptococcus pneumoniae]